MIGLQRTKVRLVPYTNRWHKAFGIEKGKLRKIFGGAAIDIQHEGSTSVIGLVAKPIIDIAVGIKTMKGARKYISILEKKGYFWRPNWGRVDQHILFAKGNEKKRTHYIHVIKYGGGNLETRYAV